MKIADRGKYIISNRFFKIILSVVLLSVILNVLTGCTEKPWNYENVVWYSDNPSIEIIKISGENSFGTLKINDTEMEIELLWGPTGTFEIVDATKKDGNTVVEDMTLLRGRVKYDKDSATLVISEDHIYENKYSSIVLQRKDI